MSELNSVFKNGKFYFTYENSCDYECIKFNEYVLWDSEDYGTGGYDEEGDEYQETIVECVKKRYNKYINKLKRYRFDIPNSGSMDAHDAASEILDDILSRKGIGNELEQCDDAVRDEIFQHWVTIIDKHN